MRGGKQLLSGKGVKKEKKTCRITRQKVGAEGSKPEAARLSTLGETEVSRLGGNTPALWSLTQETPAIALA
jgi:putative transposase